MDTPLKPCPFCGGTNIRIDEHPGAGRGTLHHVETVYSMCCYACGATFPNRYRRELLVERWNLRAAPPSDAAQAPNNLEFKDYEAFRLAGEKVDKDVAEFKEMMRRDSKRDAAPIAAQAPLAKERIAEIAAEFYDAGDSDTEHGCLDIDGFADAIARAILAAPVAPAAAAPNAADWKCNCCGKEFLAPSEPRAACPNCKAFDQYTYRHHPLCKGMNCGCTNGIDHSPECQAEHAAAIAGGRFVKDAAQPDERTADAKDKWKIVDGDCREGSNGLITYHVEAFNEGYALARASAPQATAKAEGTASMMIDDKRLAEGGLDKLRADGWAPQANALDRLLSRASAPQAVESELAKKDRTIAFLRDQNRRIIETADRIRSEPPAQAGAMLTDEQREAIVAAIFSLSLRADELKESNTSAGGTWCDDEEKAQYDAEVALISRLRSLLAAKNQEQAC